MTSSSFFEIEIRQRGRVFGLVRAEEHELPKTGAADAAVESDTHVDLMVTRPPGATTRGSVRIGTELVLVLAPGVPQNRARVDSLKDDYGEARFVYEEADPDEPGEATTVLELRIEVKGREETIALTERLVAELEAIYVGLAEDVVSRTTHRKTESRSAPSLLRPEQEISALERLRGQIAAALARIGAQPSTALVREVRSDRWRPGDSVRTSRLGELARDPETVVVGGRFRGLGRAPVSRARLTADIPEHRHIRAALKRLERRAGSILEHCSRSAVLLEKDEARWGGGRATAATVFEERHLPRIKEFRRLAERAETLRSAFRQLRESHPFVDHASAPRSRLAPTPTFLNRAGYREAYGALAEADALSGALVAGDEIVMRYRSLSSLYEFWCFVAVVKLLSDLMGKPEGEARFELVDEVFRPELAPGQEFHFRSGDARVTATYEPDFTPATRRPGAPGAGVSRFRAALATAPLRPDVTVAFEAPGQEPLILVLDAKSGARFDRDALWNVSDYRSLIFDPETGHQPVRQLFLLHRDVRAGVTCSLPGYLEGRFGRASHSVIGAVPMTPGRLDDARRVLVRFLEVAQAAAVRRERAGAGPVK